MILYLLIILISGIVAVKDLSKTIDGYIDMANPDFRFLTDCTIYRRTYGRHGLICYGVCMLTMLAILVILVIAGFRLFGALTQVALLWTCGAISILLLLTMLYSQLTIRSKGSDQVEPLMEEKWKAEKRVAPEHNEEVDLYRAAVRSNQTITWLSWQLAGVLLAGLILWFSL